MPPTTARANYPPAAVCACTNVVRRPAEHPTSQSVPLASWSGYGKSIPDRYHTLVRGQAQDADVRREGISRAAPPG